MTATLKPLRGLSAISDRYDGLLCDVWGVVHNGVRAHAKSVEALVRFRKKGGMVILVTNSPRPAPHIVEMLDGFGIAREAYDGIVSSGDLSRRLVAKYEGQSIHWVGPPEHRSMIEGLDLQLGPPEHASIVVVSDPDSYDDTLDLYEDRLAHWKRLGLEMICANPDKVVEVDGRLELCAGALADRYAELGGQVIMAGKPFPPIYDEALELLAKARGGSIDRARVLAIGDSARTDATGAAGMGLDFLFVTGSIHADELHQGGAVEAEKVGELLAPSGARVAGYMQQLVW